MRHMGKDVVFTNVQITKSLHAIFGYRILVYLVLNLKTNRRNSSAVRLFCLMNADLFATIFAFVKKHNLAPC